MLLEWMVKVVRIIQTILDYPKKIEQMKMRSLNLKADVNQAVNSTKILENHVFGQRNR